MLERALYLFIVWEEVQLEFLELQQIIRLDVAFGRLPSNEVKGLTFPNLPLRLHDPRDRLCHILIGMRELLLDNLLSFLQSFFLRLCALRFG